MPMTEPMQPRKLSIPTALTGPVELVCPICKHDEFLTFAPDIERAKKEGFRHVIVGMYGLDQLQALAVKFWHCANCGYIMKFVIGQFPSEEGKPQ